MACIGLIHMGAEGFGANRRPFPPPGRFPRLARRRPDAAGCRVNFIDVRGHADAECSDLRAPPVARGSSVESAVPFRTRPDATAFLRRGITKQGRSARQKQSGDVHSETFELGERAVRQSSLMRGAQHHARGLAGLESLLPPRRT